MSYDFYIQVDTGGEWPATVEELGNYTGNVSDIWCKALGCRMKELEGLNCTDAIPMLAKAIEHINLNWPEYEAMNPPNGWGNATGARQVLQKLLDACHKHPKAMIGMSY